MGKGLRTFNRLLPLLLLACSLSLNLYFAVHWGSRRPVKAPLLTVNAMVPVLHGRGVDGRQVIVDWVTQGTPTLVYVLSPQCAWCKRNEKSIDALVAAVGSRYRVIAVSNTELGLLDYVQRRGLHYPVYSTTDSTFTGRGTPTTFLISDLGVVEAIWVGAYGANTIREITATTGILTIPSVEPPGAQSSAALVTKY